MRFLQNDNGWPSGRGVVSDIFVWDRQFETGIAEIDQQHRKLVQLINGLGRILAQESQPETFVRSLFRVFDELADYVEYHFEFEEELMAKFNFEAAHENAMADKSDPCGF